MKASPIRIERQLPYIIIEPYFNWDMLGVYVLFNSWCFTDLLDYMIALNELWLWQVIILL